MRYPAQIEADHRKYLRLTGDDIKLLDFHGSCRNRRAMGG